MHWFGPHLNSAGSAVRAGCDTVKDWPGIDDRYLIVHEEYSGQCHERFARRYWRTKNSAYGSESPNDVLRVATQGRREAIEVYTGTHR